MLVLPIDIFLNIWLVLAALSAAYVAWDQFTGNPEPSVMKRGFVLVTLYIPHHTTNNNVEHKGGGGLTMILDVAA